MVLVGLPQIFADLKVVAEALGASDPEGTRSFAKPLLNLLDCNVGCSQEALRRTGMLAFLGDELQNAQVPGHVWVQSPVYMTMLQVCLRCCRGCTSTCNKQMCRAKTVYGV